MINITLYLNKGEVLGLVGESGSGKTTLGRTIIRLTNQDSGNIIFDNIDISNLSKSVMKKIRKDMQIIFQDPFGSLNPRHSIEHIIAEPLLVHKYGTYDEIKKRVFQLLDQVGLPKDSMKLYPHEFSGGQRQRIAIARAIALKPKFLIADEAVSALDVSIQSQILNLISDLVKEYNISMVFISHDLSVIRHISSNIAIMKKGKIVEMGNTEKVLKHPSNEYTQMLITAVPGLQSNF